MNEDLNRPDEPIEIEIELEGIDADSMCLELDLGAELSEQELLRDDTFDSAALLEVDVSTLFALGR